MRRESLSICRFSRTQAWFGVRSGANLVPNSLVRDNLVNTLNGYVQEVCPVSKPLKRESKARASGR